MNVRLASLERLNKISQGWTCGNTVFTNKNNGDIIDFAPVIKKWFIISDFVYEGFETLESAINFYEGLQENKNV